MLLHSVVDICHIHRQIMCRLCHMCQRNLCPLSCLLLLKKLLWRCSKLLGKMAFTSKFSWIQWISTTNLLRCTLTSFSFNLRGWLRGPLMESDGSSVQWKGIWYLVSLSCFLEIFSKTAHQMFLIVCMMIDGNRVHHLSVVPYLEKILIQDQLGN